MAYEPHMDPPELTVIGSGAIGGYIGARIARSGKSVQFHSPRFAEVLRSRGWSLQLVDGTQMHIPAPLAYSSTSEMRPSRWIFIATKATIRDQLPDLISPIVAPESILLTVQNGLGNRDLLQSAFPRNRVLAGLCQIGVNRSEDGIHITNFVPGDGFIQLGPNSPEDLPVIRELESLLVAAGIQVRHCHSIGEALWRKLMWNIPFNGLTVAVGGTGTDAICMDPALRKVAMALMEEIRLAANRLGHAIEPEYVEKLMGFTDRLGAYMASSVLDWKAGRSLEIEAIWQQPLREGTAAGVHMPHLATLTAILNRIDHR